MKYLILALSLGLFLFAMACGDGGSGTGVDTESDVDSDTDGDSDIDTDTDGDTDTDSDTDTDGDTDTNTDGDTDTQNEPDSSTDTTQTTDSDSDTGTEQSLCPQGQHAACYGDDVWCMNADSDPQNMVDACEGGEVCVDEGNGAASCTCTEDVYRRCYAGDVWSYNSCDEMSTRALDCSGSELCIEFDTDRADCCVEQSTQECGPDGDIRWVTQCISEPSFQTGVSLACVDNASCVNTGTPSCECRNEWFGTDCDQCPTNWNADADCSECDGGWTGATCDTCGGYNAGNVGYCQCPSDLYLPQWNSSNCWTCGQPLVSDGTSGNGCGGDGDGYHWNDAEAACPAGFRLPSLEEVLVLFPGWGEINGNYTLDPCADSLVCEGVFGTDIYDYPYSIWTTDECTEGHLVVGLRTGSVDCLADDSVWTGVVCVR